MFGTESGLAQWLPLGFVQTILSQDPLTVRAYTILESI